MLLGIAFLAFVSLGLPDGVLGVAWPSMRQTFELPISQLGWLLAAAMAGYLASSFGSGAMVARLGVGQVLLWSSALTATSTAAYALAPAWPVMIAAGVVTGLGAGGIDAGINAYAAVSFSPRMITWLHASYGVGALAGPLVMTGALTGGLGWRWGYGLIALALTAMMTCFALTVRLWRSGGVEVPEETDAAAPPGLLGTLRRPVVVMSAALFLVYTGLEVTAGQWTYSLFTESRGMSPAMAGAWVSAFWASLTAGRVLGGALATRVAATTLLRASMAAAPVGAGVIWLCHGHVATLVGLVLLGLALAPVYPFLIAQTPARLGALGTAHAVGFQVAAAYLGTAALPGAAGMLARALGLEAIGPFMLAVALALVVLHELTLARSRAEARRDPRGARRRPSSRRPGLARASE